jgi:hypothetical protein
MEAQQLFAVELSAGHLARLGEDAQRIYEQTTGDASRADLHELAAYYEFLANQQLGRQDLALQLGKRFLTEFPGSRYNPGVEVQMQALANEKEARLRGKAELAKLDADRKKDESELAADERAFAKQKADALAEKDAARRARLVASLATTENGLGLRRLNLEEQPCVDAYRSHQVETAIERCRAFLTHHAAGGSATVVERIQTVRWYLVLALKDAGRFEETRREVKPLLDDPTYGVSARYLQSALPAQPPTAK